MAFLPSTPLTLTGGCFCSSNRYTISVPELSQRPIHPTARATPISATESVETRIPVIDIDHCVTCRRVSGGIFQVWFICPSTWVTWELSLVDGTSKNVPCDEAVGPLPTSPSDTNSFPGNIYLTRFNATDLATRSFCSKCGTNLTYFSHQRSGANPSVDIAVGSMDQASLELCKPDRHGCWDFGTENPEAYAAEIRTNI